MFKQLDNSWLKRAVSTYIVKKGSQQTMKVTTMTAMVLAAFCSLLALVFWRLFCALCSALCAWQIAPFSWWFKIWDFNVNILCKQLKEKRFIFHLKYGLNTFLNSNNINFDTVQREIFIYFCWLKSSNKNIGLVDILLE